MLRILGLFISVLPCAADAGAQPRGQPAAKTGDLRETVKRLVNELASDSRAVRVKAEQELLNLGPRILRLLPPPELTSDVSVREIVRRVRIRLDHAQAKGSVLASRVTLKGKYSAGRILAEIAKQTGNRVDSKLADSDKQKSLNVNYDKATFWQTVQDVSNRAGVAFEPNSAGDGLSARVAKPRDRITVANNSSAFRIAVLRAKWKPVPGDAANRLLVLTWSVTAEPRLRPLFLKFNGRQVTATGNGKPLAAFSADAKLEIPVTGGAEPIELRTAFLVPKSKPLASVAFQGKLRIQTAAAQESIAFRQLAKSKGVAKRRGGVTVTVRELEIGEKETTVGVAVAYDTGGPAFESHRLWIFRNRVSLQTANGRGIAPQPGPTTTLQRDGAIGIRYKFTVAKVDAAKAGFRYIAPTLLIDVPVEFSFAKVPVPRPSK